MTKRVKSHPRPSEVDMGARALEEYREIERRLHHQRVREDLVDRGAIRESVEKLLEEAAPRFKAKGWTVTKGEQ